MEQHLAVTFSPGQLAILVVVLAALVWWGVMRLVSGIDKRFDGIDKRFDAFGQQLDKVRQEHPTRPEMQIGLDGVHRRVDDLHAVVHGERPERRG